MRRAVVRILLLLAAGAVVDVGVAWTIKIRWPNSTSRELPVPAEDAMRLRNKYMGNDSKWDFARWTRYSSPGRRYDIVAVGDNVLIVSVSSVGWPALTLCGTSKIDRDGTKSWYATWKVRTAKTDEHLLPLEPLWPGFAFNTTFYAVILWLLIAAPGPVQRMIRRKRGLCSACGYPVGTSAVCTECGTALAK